MHTIACIGAGVVGCSWAVVFARAGRTVRIWDAAPGALEVAQARIRVMVADLSTQTGLDAATVTARIGFGTSLEDAVTGAEHVQESVSERLEIKRALFAELDRLADHDAVLASSTSAIPASRFASGLPGAARCLVAHPVNPPHLIPLVELCPSPDTAQKTIERTAALMAEVGQSPILLAREIEGFALNRLQWALLSEAVHLVGEGYCTAEEIDRIMTDGLALRWALMGPLAVGHLNAATGLDGYFHGLSEAIGRVQRSLRTDYRPAADVIAGMHAAMASRMPVRDLALHQAKRDRDITALRAFLASR